ncbi:MAG: DUF4978 domain-containing protein [Actinobacteria bacterium]|nr:DUF4978 domain-containing protein [Actinomycetota bacterium]MCG2818570.1 DUF4978 domain-containing protein [Actinomycetes bacterium]MBU4218241.1 DUF4978 domain-containing protein [Actinomycetota bacterium]MBU4358666.1 DUF4978 domain-containing protein [Actinomycetota bacterium]MBU4392019.1 DUF4978 domain-containing protein [Actinomycetota bacterium]
MVDAGERVQGKNTRSGKRAPALVSVLLVLVLIALAAPSPVTEEGRTAGPVTVSEFRASDGKQALYVDGDPFLGLAIQLRWDWFHELNGWSLESLEPLFGHCADIGFNTVSCPVLWGKIEPTDMEPTDDTWDFSTVDWVIDNARAAGLKVELLWFGMNVCGGVTCDTNDQFPEWIVNETATYQRLMKGGSPYKGWHLNWGTLYTFCPRGTKLLAEEKEAVEALMEHVSVKCAADHDVIGVQIENEPVVRSPNPLYFTDPPDRCECAGCDAEYAAGSTAGTYESEEHFSSVCLTRYMDDLARVVKESSYRVITILNFMDGQPNDQDMETCLEESSCLDAVGIDIYQEDVANYLGQLEEMRTQSIPYGNAPNVGERYPRWTSQFMLASFAKDCYRHNIYEIMSPPKADYTYLGEYSLLYDPDMTWKDEAYNVHDFLGLLSRDIQDIAEKSDGSQMVYFHCGENLKESSCSETRDLMGTDIHYETNDYGLGMAIWDQDYIALLSTKDVVFDIYSIDYPLTAECGYFDADHAWVKEADAELEYRDSTGYGVKVGALECVRLTFKQPDPDPDPDPDGGRTEWNFAEGCTRAGFETWLCVQNPGQDEATATITYMFADGTTEDKEHTVAPNSRYTVSVNEEVGPEKDVSMRVTSDRPVIVERPIYFDYAGLGGHPTWQGGHTVVGY